MNVRETPRCRDRGRLPSGRAPVFHRKAIRAVWVKHTNSNAKGGESGDSRRRPCWTEECLEYRYLAQKGINVLFTSTASRCGTGIAGEEEGGCEEEVEGEHGGEACPTDAPNSVLYSATY